MPGTKTNLLLSLDVYLGTSEVTSGWQRIDYTDRSSGLFAAAYQRGNEIVVSFRGWDQLDPRDAPDIARAYFNGPFEQIGDAQDFIDRILSQHPGVNLSLTGHSLGGALAAIMAVRNGLKAETFAAIESVSAAFKSMDGYDYDPIPGVTLWDIDPANQNSNIAIADLRNYADVVNRVVFGDIATYNDKTVPYANHIGVDRVYGRLIENGILTNDSEFGRYFNSTGKAFTDIVPSNVKGAPYSESFATALHSLGFHALQLFFNAEMNALWVELPRLALQLTNDRLATEADGSGDYRMTFDALDGMMFNHLDAPGSEATVAEAALRDWQDIAAAGDGSVSLSNADVNMALIQLATQYAAEQVLGDNAPGVTQGIIEVASGYLQAALDGSGKWGTDGNPEGARLIRFYADSLLGQAGALQGGQIVNAAYFLTETADGGAVTIDSGTGRSDIIFGGAGSDALNGNAGSDAIFGLAGRDAVNGGYGHDILVGGRGGDQLSGDGGSDVFIGGPGSDQLTGGAGIDSFVFTAPGNGPLGDGITDFTPGTDEIVLIASRFTGIGPGGALTADAFVIAAMAAEADDRIIYNDVNGALWFDADGNGIGAAIRLATLDTGLALSASDFAVL